MTCNLQWSRAAEGLRPYGRAARLIGHARPRNTPQNEARPQSGSCSCTRRSIRATFGSARPGSAPIGGPLFRAERRGDTASQAQVRVICVAAFSRLTCVRPRAVIDSSDKALSAAKRRPATPDRSDARRRRMLKSGAGSARTSSNDVAGTVRSERAKRATTSSRSAEQQRRTAIVTSARCARLRHCRPAEDGELPVVGALRERSRSTLQPKRASRGSVRSASRPAEPWLRMPGAEREWPDAYR